MSNPINPVILKITDGSSSQENVDQQNPFKLYQEQSKPREYFPPKMTVQFKSLDLVQNG